ncbi:uncharacterized protein FIBRA_03819 [Fibroporia radiculosa]|uniref:Uncharacterized protein n=1 Tax=Fibroporia radiculosa TaxID=599839 RepID=J4G6D7_9APHY|nr:uncharacterized protein FIBRA_03819 [Fibroporia radiculosa]CCM01753.1 predicted protein [Fibroporia radiculosa]
MAGHRRPNGSPICPARSTSASLEPQLERSFRALRRNNAKSDLEVPPSGFLHHRNPNWVEQDSIPPDDDRWSPTSWVSTEPVDESDRDGFDDSSDISISDISVEDSKDMGEDLGLPETPSRASSVLSRTLSQVLGKSKPLASLFSTPSEDLAAISQAARRHRLAMGIMRSPAAARGTQVKLENDFASGANAGRQNAWWVVMGRDPDAVSHLLGRHEQGARGQQGDCLDGNWHTGTLPPHSRFMHTSFLELIFAGAVGGLLVFCGLSVI